MLAKRLFVPALLALILSDVSGTAQKILQPTTPGRTNPNPVVTRPDSIEDRGLHNSCSRMAEQDRTGGALLGKVVVKDDVLRCGSDRRDRELPGEAFVQGGNRSSCAVI